MTRARFEQLVSAAIRTIPPRFREELRNIAVMVEDEPPDDLLDEMGIDPPDTLFGLYQGPIEDASETDDDVVVAVGETLIHEVGHYFGLSEEELEDIEEQYWRAQDGSPETGA